VTVILVMPPNQLAGYTFVGVLLALGLIYVVRVRRAFRLPDWVETPAKQMERTGG
jgi:hypothetical protein